MTVDFRNDGLLDIPMKKPSQIFVGAAVLALAVAGGYFLGHRGAAPAAQDGTPASAVPAKKLLHYRNPMGLPDTSPVPKKDTMGMDYILSLIHI